MEESGASWILWVIRANPFTYAVELLRFALYGELNQLALAVTVAVGLASFALASRGYDPQKGMLGRKPRDET